jgi:type IV secretion system protein VirD4
LSNIYLGDDNIIKNTIPLIIVVTVMGLVFLLITVFSYIYSLNSIKSKTVGDGQHGTARFATKNEIRKTYKEIPFEVELWRQGKNLPEFQGTLVGQKTIGKRTKALIDDGDVHTLMIGAAGVGKTAYFLYPNLEFACASGMSFITSDTKGDLYRNYGEIAKKYYGYNVSVIDLRNPTRSDGFNLLYLVNKYMDFWKENEDEISYKAKAEKYAKITSKTIISSGSDTSSYGQNAYFYDAAEGLLTASILLVSEFCPKGTRHIITVFKIIQELLKKEDSSKKNDFSKIMDLLPDEHKAKWFAGAALNTSDQSMASVISTTLSRLNTFLDSEMESILCFDTSLDAEKFCNTKSAVFLVMPEEDSSKYFMISLIVQQLYREILLIADEKGGKLDNRVMMYLDEMGTIPKFESAEMMFSASRSRRVSIVAIIQSFAQLNQNYGENGAEIITDNTQLTIFGGFAPNSKSAEILSKAMGNRTVMSGSISKSKNDPSQSLQMIERPLMTPDELKSMPKGQFIVMKTGSNPMISKLKLFFKWGIKFNDTYKLTEREKEKIKYSSKNELKQEILKRYPRADRLNKTVNNSDTPYSYTQKTRRAPRFDNY